MKEAALFVRKQRNSGVLKFFKDDLICIECLVNNLFHEGKLRKGANKTFFRDSEQSEQYSWETNRIKDRITKQSQIMMERKELALETKSETEKERKKELKKLEDQHREFDQQINKIFEKFTNEIISRYQSKIDLIDKKINTEKDVSPNYVSFISDKKLKNVKSHFNSQQILKPVFIFNRIFVDYQKIDYNSGNGSNSDSASDLDFDSSTNSDSDQKSNINLKILNKSNSENENESQNENEKEKFKENDGNIESGSD
ncbi:hypothetical protein M0813_00954 [Anaeramoeba flamelloides]|uniref:Uncharacterized protein n=1 Tax=Anaeramoeba flamelloides TaxID=1746091 RepID=A0ABQ8X426_9EUKA|nr:hypothetical protein M0813_00954 [Anaeramoeba flamelloides]